MIESNCMLCGSEEAEVLLDKLSLCKKNSIQNMNEFLLSYKDEVVNYRHVICKNCGLVYQSPHLEEHELIDFYQEQYRERYTAGDCANSELPFTKEHLGLEIYNAVVRYDYLEKLGYLSCPKKALDIGSSLGALPAYFKFEGHDAKGIELSQFGDYSQTLFGDISIIKTSIEAYETDEKYDLITLCDVLEHIANPKKVLEKVRSLLSDEGVLLIEIPDIFKPHKSVMGFFSNAHLFTFSENSFRNLLAISGFEVISFAYGGYCKNMRFIVKQSEVSSIAKVDSWQKILNFVVGYDQVYMAWNHYVQKKITYTEAKEIINTFIPEYIMLNYVRATEYFFEGNYEMAHQLFSECLESDFNEENPSLQAGSIEAFLAFCDFRLKRINESHRRVERAYDMLPKLYRFPYLDYFRKNEIFDMDSFVQSADLPYVQLNELKQYFENNENFRQNRAARQ